ncbi:hypothetical protein Poli38472_013673 [Pythium oligandrum]|uniref:Protein-serine/threonine phosphatase n=1 Tax=Pythium oligandrum TaxID=41045 RepID=A0A8K1CDK7_PYTOL|nr:hypothetical protein Poli38472_013673 [Pythium oligandrum]|eukprot:TMW61210.1 hypothetical protein Poli38472_013673 [Pythium oligandrum]
MDRATELYARDVAPHDDQDHDDAIKMADEMPPTLEVLRKYDDVELRRRSATLLDSALPTSDPRIPTSIDRARQSGVNRLLRSTNFESVNVSALASFTPIMSAPVSTELWEDHERNPWTHVVLKMTSFSEDDIITSFCFGEDGGTIGRDASNDAAIPADKLLANIDHARVVYRYGRFYITNSSNDNAGTYIRLSPCTPSDEEEDKMQWPLDTDVTFRAGKSDFLVTKFNEEAQTLEISALSGKLNGSKYTITAKGAGIGRSAENLIHAGDGELSRKHCSIWFDSLTQQFYLIDLGSTNGTFMKLSGPYQEPYRLEIGDDLLVAQTCLTVNRFDYGSYASMGARKQMEDAHVVVQDLQVPVLTQLGLHPQSFFAVYDGHGGMEASRFLGETLHHSVAMEFWSKRKLLVPDEDAETPEDTEELHSRIEECLVNAFQRTDDEFLATSERPQAGSTATTVLIAGKYVYVANVGDSRTVMSKQGGVAVRLSNDHKPSRPDEAQRIRDTGGFVIHGRIMGELAVSRAFGDSPFKQFDLSEPSVNSEASQDTNSKPRSEYDSQELPVNPNDILKGPLVIPTPEITRTELTGEEEFILLASDGLYDVLKDQEAVDYLRRKIIEIGDVQRAVETMVEHAIVHQRSMDNVTAVVIMFQEPRMLRKPQGPTTTTM